MLWVKMARCRIFCTRVMEKPVALVAIRQPVKKVPDAVLISDLIVRKRGGVMAEYQSLVALPPGRVNE